MAELFDEYCINAVQNSVGKAPSCIRDPSNPENDSCTVRSIISENDNHPIIKDLTIRKL